MQVSIAYSFKKAKSGSINPKVNLKKVSLVCVDFDVGSVVGRMMCSHKIISRLCGQYVGGYHGLDSGGCERENVFSHYVCSMYGNQILPHPLCPGKKQRKKPEVQSSMYCCNFTVTHTFSEGEVTSACISIVFVCKRQIAVCSLSNKNDHTIWTITHIQLIQNVQKSV